jgi:decaprenylphospho-beta-D-erythro-pentofuranosid-2-ulose 2-reductase
MTEKPLALILAVTSDIGRAVAHACAAAGHDLVVTTRDRQRLEIEVADLGQRYPVTVQGLELDVLDRDQCRRVPDQLPRLPDLVVCAIGLMPAQADSQADPDLAERVMQTNYIAPALLLEQLAELCRARGSGTLVGISSVAGDRGRRSNYIYGSAKAGFSAYLSGLRSRMHEHGVSVITVKPGFVRTRMTEGMQLPALLTVNPEQVARSILKAVKGPAKVVYVKPLWRGIMWIIGLLPEPIFMRLKL